MDYDHLSPTGSRSPLTSSNSSCPDPNPASTDAGDYNSITRPTRACEYCRQHKVRCDIDPRDPSRPCGRCIKANRDCISSSHSRKRRKTTDSRVLELERKVERLTSRLDVLEKKGGSGGNSNVGLEHDLVSEKTNPSESPTLLVHPPATSDTSPDVIDLGIISIELAGRIFQHFVTEFVPIFPGVAFPPNTASSDVRRQKPTLFLAILVAASGVFDDSLYKKLQIELVKNFSDQIMFRGLRSLDILQALIVTILWFSPPEDPSKNNINQLVHLAASIAIDIQITKSGGNKKPPMNPEVKKKVEQQWSETFPGWRFMAWGVYPDPSLPECRRALLSCYFLCENASRLLRRPYIFAFTSYIGECIEFLETSNEPGILSSDKILAQWIKVSRISEEFGLARGLGEARGEQSLLETRGKVILEEFRGRIMEWRHKSQAVGLTTPALDIYYQCVIKHMYDWTLHPANLAEDFRLLAFETLIVRSQRGNLPLQSTPLPIDTTRLCLASVHSCLDTFLESPQDFFSSLPYVFFIEMGYSITLLVKIFITVVLSKPADKTLKVNEIRLGEYAERSIHFLATIMEHNKCRAVERLHYILVGLKSLVEKHKQKFIEICMLSSRGSAPSCENPSTASTFPPTPSTPQTYIPPSQVRTDTVPQPFGGFPNPSYEQGGFSTSSIQNLDFEDPMIWDNFPLTEFLQFEGLQDVYPPWG